MKYDRSGWGRGSEGWIDLTFLKLFYGPFYSKLMRQVDDAVDAGCDVVQKIHMVAERRTGRYCHEAALILDYIDGEVLEKCGDEKAYYPEVGKTIATLHRYGLAACDLASHNFIITPHGLKIIDLSCRGAIVIGQVKDAIRLQRHYGITLPMTTPFRKFAFSVISRYQAARKVYSRWRKNRRSARI